MFKGLQDKDTRKVWVGTGLTAVGLLGMLYFLYFAPPHFHSIYASAQWAAGTTLFAIVALAGIPGIYHKKLTSRHLKIVDLIWVLASAVAVAFAVVEATQYTEGMQRTAFTRNVEKSRSVAKDATAQAYKIQCLQPSSLTAQQCEQLRTLAIVVHGDGLVPPNLVESLCPFPIQLSSPPLGFGAALVEACIQSNFVARSPDHYLLVDQPNVDAWRQFTHFWPVWLIILVALRAMKSIAEVFWGVK
jgi:hypothetical protein